MSKPRLKVLVLAGGPDRERKVSLESGKTVSENLRLAGHDVLTRDIGPDNLAAIEEFKAWAGDAIFPALHGGWGEGGGLQQILDDLRIPYVGCRQAAAALCMDKYATKQRLVAIDLPTLPYELIGRTQEPTIEPPLVIKAPREGSSIDLVICHTAEEVTDALLDLRQRHERLMIEKFCKGMEITVGVLEEEAETPEAAALTPLPLREGLGEGRPKGNGGAPVVAHTSRDFESRPSPGPSLEGRGTIHALPPIRIIPATTHYNYDAKYNRNDTQYLLDPAAIGLAPPEIEGLGVLATEVFQACGCRHMARIDFIVDDQHRPWVLEVNTIPGFTSHSLLPMAAKHAGIELPHLVDRLVRLAVRDG